MKLQQSFTNRGCDLILFPNTIKYGPPLKRGANAYSTVCDLEFNDGVNGSRF